MKASKFFSTKQKQLLSDAIQEAELKTSGEIRVHVENHCQGDEIERARVVFFDLHMEVTEHKNGVLIYLAIEDKKFAILGDEGIDKVVPNNFWDTMRDELKQHFQRNDFTAGLVNAIGQIGEKLVTYFPYQSDDINELSDEISFYNN